MRCNTATWVMPHSLSCVKNHLCHERKVVLALRTELQFFMGHRQKEMWRSQKKKKKKKKKKKNNASSFQWGLRGGHWAGEFVSFFPVSCLGPAKSEGGFREWKDTLPTPSPNTIFCVYFCKGEREPCEKISLCKHHQWLKASFVEKRPSIL